MKNILRAVLAAMLLVTGAHSGAQAATVDGPIDTLSLTQVETPVVGTNYFFAFNVGTLPALPPDYPTGDDAYSRLFMTISGQGATTTTSSIVQGDASNKTFTFNWIWGEAGPATLTFTGYLERYKNAVPIYMRVGQQEVLGGLSFTDNTSIFERTDFGPITWSNAPAASPTAVPIGGTLPLMLSALGVGAWVMRRRVKRVALA